MEEDYTAGYNTEDCGIKESFAMQIKRSARSCIKFIPRKNYRDCGASLMYRGVKVFIRSIFL